MPAHTDPAREPGLPGKLRLADAAALVLAGMAVFIAIAGGRRYVVFGTVLALRSPLLLVYAAASVLIVRHLLWPRPSAIDHLRAVRAALRARPDAAAALSAFLATRPAILAIGFLAVVTFGTAAPPGSTLSNDPVANLPARFDAGWYGDIALNGYSWDHTFQRQRNIAFFPALPLLMRPVGAVFGMHERTAPRDRRMLRGMWAGVVISLAAFLWALHYVVRLGRPLVGQDAAAHAALLLAAYPFAVFFGAPYTESLYLLAAVGAFYHFTRGEWAAAGAWGLLLGLTRPNGCLASLPLAILGVQQLRAAAGPWHATAAGVRLLTAATPVLGMLLFTAYLYNLTGVEFAWARSHLAWGRAYEGIGPFVRAFDWIRDTPIMEVIANAPYNTLNGLAVLFGLALTYPVFRRLGAAWGVFVLLNLVPPLFAGGVLSMGRLTSTLFPLFLVLPLLIPARAVPALAAAFGLGQGLCAALFFTWRELF
ncbi:MAG: hypothetical protein M3Q85_14465 [Acidobacteriota bacterium]|nr:hypothetical protein [Acidobacteriota bacterium]